MEFPIINTYLSLTELVIIIELGVIIEMKYKYNPLYTL